MDVICVRDEYHLPRRPETNGQKIVCAAHSSRVPCVQKKAKKGDWEDRETCGPLAQTPASERDGWTRRQMNVWGTRHQDHVLMLNAGRRVSREESEKASGCSGLTSRHFSIRTKSKGEGDD